MPASTYATSSSAAAYPSPPATYLRKPDEDPKEQPSAPKSMLTVTLEAVPDQASSSSRARRLRVAAHDVPVGGLREARDAVGRFISTHRVGRPSFGPACGIVRRDGRPICRVDYELRLWAVDGRGEVTGHELGVDGGIVGFDAAGGR